MIVVLVAALLGAAPAPPRAVGIEPSAAVLPANMLRVYVRFDRSARGVVQQSALVLEDGEGARMPDPFMDFGQELWSPDGRRLTVLFDPGKVKRDVEGEGVDAAPLRPGVRYRLRIGTFARSFTTGRAERRPLSPVSWTVTPPAGPRGVVSVNFHRVMDPALLVSQLRVEDDHGRVVAGVGSVSDGDGRWRFTPSARWSRSAYVVVAGGALEDICGNRVGEALDHDLDRPETPTGVVRLPFGVQRNRATRSVPPRR